MPEQKVVILPLIAKTEGIRNNVSANRNDVKTPAVRRRWCKAGLVCKRL
jgi:hypothetical protein